MVSRRSPIDGLGLNPLDWVEGVAEERGWCFQREGEQELMAAVNGRWSDYHLWFTWRDELNSLQFTCAYEKEVPEARRSEVSLLMALINERMWLGHFDLWSDEGILMFHHALLLGNGGTGGEQCEELVDIGIAECERHYPAFQFVISERKSAREALLAALLDTVGEA